MKKIILFAFVLFSVSLQAQLNNTRWRGVLKGDNPQSVLLDFKENNFNVYTVSDSSMVERMLFTNDKTSFEVKKIDGQSDCDNTTPGKYQFTIKKDSLFIKVISDACGDRSSAIDDTKWIRWKAHPEVKVAESILKKYVGTYANDDQHHIFVTYENGYLQIEGPNNNLPKVPMIPESNTRFFVKIAGVELDFVKDEKGDVIKLVSHEDKDFELKKIK